MEAFGELVAHSTVGHRKNVAFFSKSWFRDTRTNEEAMNRITKFRKVIRYGV